MIQLTQNIGDSKTHSVPLRWNGRPFAPGTGWTLLFTVKANASQTDAQRLFQKTSAYGIAVSGNTANVEVTRADTFRDSPAFEATAGEYVWDIQAYQIAAPNHTRTVASGTLTLNRDVTRLSGPTGPIFVVEDPQISVVGPAGPQGPIGATGPAGPTGPNTVSTSTTTNLNGYIFGNGTTVGGATEASYGGNNLADFNKLAKFNVAGGLSAASVNKVIITQPANFATLTIADFKTINAQGSISTSATGSITTNAGGSFATGTGNLTGPNTSGTIALTSDIPPAATVDATVIDGSTNAVSGNAVFDALALKAPLADPTLTGEVVINTLVGVNKDSLTINNTSDGDGLYSYGLKINKSGVDSIGLDVYVGPNIENGIGVYSNVSGESSIGLVSVAYGDYSNGAAINSSGYGTKGLTITSDGTYSTGIVVESSGTENVGMLINSTVGDYQAIFSDMGTRKSFVARLNGAFGWFRGTLLGAMFTGRIQAADTLTEDRTYTLPDASGTVALINPSSGTQTFSGAQSFTGNVGIGTATPANALHVAASGGIRVDAGFPSGALNVGADVNSNTRSSNVRKLASFVAPEYTNTRTVEFFNFDSATSSSVIVSFGGRSGGSQYAATQLNFLTAANTSTLGGTTVMTISPFQRVGIGTTSPSAKLHTIATTEQLRVGYDASNYLSTTVSSAGLVTLNAVGTSTGFVFSDKVTASSQGESKDLAQNDVITSQLHRSNLLFEGLRYVPYSPSLNSAGGTIVAGNYGSINVDAGATTFRRMNLSPNVFLYNGTGGTCRFDHNFRIAVTGTFYITLPSLVEQRIYVGSQGSFALPFAGLGAYPANTRGYGFKVRQNPSTANQLQVAVFARDGTSAVAGTYIESGWVNFGVNFISTSSTQAFVLEKIGTTVNLYGTDTRDSNTSGGPRTRTPSTVIATVSGTGVPNDYAHVATNWSSVEAAIIGDGTTANTATNQNLLIRSGFMEIF